MQNYSTENVRQISIQRAQECLVKIDYLEQQIKKDGPFREDSSSYNDTLHSAMHTMSLTWREMVLRQQEKQEAYEKALSICALEKELGNPENKLVLLETELRHARKDMEN